MSPSRSLRTKVFIIFAVTYSLVICFVYFISKGVILKRFESVQTTDAARNMERVIDILDQEYIRLVSTGRDWGSWGETYEFILDLNQPYITNNLNDETISNLDLNLMLYFDNGKNFVFGKAYDLENGSQTPIPAAFLRQILENDNLFSKTLKEGESSGILVHPEGFPVLFAAVPILTDESTGPARGFYIICRYFTSGELERISRISRVDLNLIPLTGAARDSEIDALVSQLEDKEGGIIRPLSRTSNEASILLRDFNGNPAMILQGELPRDIVLAGESAQRLFLFLVMIATLIISLIMALAFKKTVLSRLYMIISQVTEIRKTRDQGAVVSVTGSDELSLLAQSINGMLAGIHESHNLSESLINTTPIPIMAMDMEGNVTEWNPAAARAFGWSREETVGESIFVLMPDTVNGFDMFREKLLCGADLAPFEAAKVRKNGTPIELLVYPSRLTDFDGRVSGCIAVMTDITDIRNRDLQLQRTVSEKDMLLKEVHHRVKNNLQAISSILDIQKMHLKNEQLAEIFRESQNRIRSMALIHEELYNSRDQILVNTGPYISQLLDHLLISYDVDRTRISLDLQIQEIFLNIDTAIPCGLIINELVSNSLKHAFDGKKNGVIKVSFAAIGGVNRLRISDNGVGLPENLDLEKVPSLGMILVRSLADQLNSTMRVVRQNGTTFEFDFQIYEECQKSQL